MQVQGPTCGAAREVLREDPPERLLDNSPDATPEDQMFTKYTPTGDLSFTCQNPALSGKFLPGQVYYLDLVPVDE